MPISPTDTQRIEAHLAGRLAPVQRLLLEARLLLDPGFKAEFRRQQQVMAIVRTYGREQLRQELDHLHQQLMTQPETSPFSQLVHQIFRTT